MTQPLRAPAGAALAAAILLAAGIVASLAWAQGLVPAGADADRLLASVRPGHAAAELAAQLSGAPAGRHFNQPLGTLALLAGWAPGLCAIGLAAAGRVVPEDAGAAERLGFAFAAGFLVAGLLVFAVACAGVPPVTWPLGALAALAAGLAMRGREVARLVRECVVPAEGASLARSAALAGLAAAGAFLLVAAMTPPIQSDGMRYHLGALQEYVRAGGIEYLPLNAFSNFPFLPEMHFLMGVAWGMPEFAQLSHVVTALMAAALVASLARRCGASLPVLGPAAGVLYLGLPASAVVATWPFIDHAVVLFSVGALLAALHAVRDPRPAPFVLCGLMAAGAVGSKYTAVATCVLPGLLLVAAAVRGTGAAGVRLRWVVMAAAVLLALGGPWYMKNMLLTGNPVYPLAHGVFGGGEWTAEAAAFYADRVADKGGPRTAAGLATGPVRAMIGWTKYEGHQIAPLGPVLLLGALLGAGLVLLGARGGGVRGPALYAWGALAALVLSYGLWFYTYQSNRMLLPAFAFAVPLVAAGIGAIPQRVVRRGVLVMFAAGVVHAFAWSAQWVFTGTAHPPALLYLVGAMSREEYLSRALSWYRPAQDAARRLAAGSGKVLLVGEYRIFYVPFAALWSDWFDTPAILHVLRAHDATTSGSLELALRREGVGAVLINRGELEKYSEQFYRPRFTDEEWRIAEEFLDAPRASRVRLPPGGDFFLLDTQPAGGPAGAETP